MFRNESEWNKVKIAYKTTKIEELFYLSRDENSGVKIAVANNFYCTKEILDFLSKDENWWVRIAVAKHPNTSSETLGCLGDKEEIWPVKKTLLENENTPIDILERISKDDIKRWVAERKIEFRF